MSKQHKRIALVLILPLVLTALVLTVCACGSAQASQTNLPVIQKSPCCNCPQGVSSCRPSFSVPVVPEQVSAAFLYQRSGSLSGISALRYVSFRPEEFVPRIPLDVSFSESAAPRDLYLKNEILRI